MGDFQVISLYLKRGKVLASSLSKKQALFLFKQTLEGMKINFLLS